MLSLAAVSITVDRTASALHNILTPISIPKKNYSQDQHSWSTFPSSISRFEEDLSRSVERVGSLAVNLDSLAQMPNGTSFSARARAAELNAERARKAADRLEKAAQVWEADEVPPIAPTSLGAFTFVTKRGRSRTGREGRSHNDSIDRLQSDMATKDRNSARSTQVSQIDSSASTVASPYPPLNPAAKSYASKDFTASQQPRASSIEKITQARSTSLQPSVASSESTNRLYKPSHSPLTTAAQSFGALEPSDPEMPRKREGGLGKSGRGTSRNTPHESQNLQAYPADNTAIPFYHAARGNENMRPYSDDVRNSPYYHQMASPRHENYDSPSHAPYGYGFHGQNVYQNPAQPYGMHPQASQFYGPSQLPTRQATNLNYTGIENQPPNVARSASTVGNLDTAGPGHFTGYKTHGERSHEDPFMENPITSSRQGNFGRYQASSNFSNFPHGRTLPPAVKGTRADQVRSEHFQPYQFPTGTAGDHFELPRQAPSPYGQSQPIMPEALASKEFLHSNSTDIEKDAVQQLNSGQPNSNVVSEFTMARNAQSHSKKTMDDGTSLANEDPSMGVSSTLDTAKNLPFSGETGNVAANVMSDYDPYTLKASDPLPLAGQWPQNFPHRRRTSAEMTVFPDVQQQPGFEYQQSSDPWNHSINTGLHQTQGHPDSQAHQFHRQFRPDVDVFHQEPPPEHQEVRKIMLRQAGYESLPTSNANMLRKLFAGSEPLGTASSREPKHAPIGSERRRSSVHNENAAEHFMSKEEANDRAAIEIFAPVLANLHSYAAGSNRDYFSRYGQPPAWAIDHSAEGNKSLFGGEWGNPPQRVARDPRYLGQGTMHEGRMTYFEDLSKHGSFGAGTGNRGIGSGRGRGH